MAHKTLGAHDRRSYLSALAVWTGSTHSGQTARHVMGMLGGALSSIGTCVVSYKDLGALEAYLASVTKRLIAANDIEPLQSFVNDLSELADGIDDMLDQIAAQMQEYQEIIERRQQLEERMAEQRAEQERLDREIAEKFGMDDYMELDDIDPSDMIGGDDDETPIPFESAGDADDMAPSSWNMSDIDSMIDEASDGRLKGSEYSLDSLDDVEPQDGSDGFADIDTGMGDGGFLDDVPTPSQSAGGGFSIGQAASVPDIVSSYQHQPGESAFGDDPFADADDRYADDAEPDATGDGGESIDPFADFANVAELEGDDGSEELPYSPLQSEVSGMFDDADDGDQPSDIPDVSDLFDDADDGYDQPQYDDGQNGYDDAGDVGVDDFDDDDIGKLINSAAMSI